ncbi:PAS domain S-box-containing protein [Actinoplanes couchii]|uniref:PAS domain S-box protein n=6 Tax=Actinoplanes couchii TaxID=403638 RepID=UPI0028667C56|nr:PAS domain S-box protein [Actinoplanes couchii]MDR6324513.1 PAS domain S-box-containing protein [Actinoplanes couchii]
MKIVPSRAVSAAVSDPARLAAVASTGLIELSYAPVLDRITGLAARIVGGAVTMVSLVEQDRQCFVSSGGPSAGAVTETPLTHSYCKYVVESGEPLVVPDAREHPLLHDSPAITDYRAISYLGVPLRSPDGHILGTLCAGGSEPRDWSDDDVAAMEDLAVAATAEIAARISAAEAARAADLIEQILDSTLDAFLSTGPSGLVTSWNREAERMFGWTEAEAIGRDFSELVIAPDDREAYLDWLARTEAQSAAAGRRVAFQSLHRGGRRFPVEFSLTVLSRPDGPDAYLFVRDLTAARHSERLRSLEYSVAGVLASAQSVEQATAAVVGAVGETLHWPYAEYWHLDAEGTDMERLAVWSRDPASTARMTEWDAIVRGSGVVGEEWDAGTAIWISDVPGTGGPRADAARESALRTAAAAPVRNGTDVVGVLAIFDRRDTERDPDLLATLDTVAAYIGQYVHRRHAEELELELSRARREFDRIVSNLSDYLYTVRITAEGEVHMVYASPNTGVFGGPLPDAGDLGFMTDLVHGDDRAALEAYSGNLMSEMPAQMECRLIGFDGVTRWVWARAFPRREDGVLYVDGVCSDVTQRHHDHARLRQQAELLDLAPTAVIVRDLDDRITWWNRGAEATYGWSAEAAVGCPTHRLLDTRFPVLRTLVDQSLTAEGEWHGEVSHLRSDGSRIIVLSHQAMQYDEDGAPVAILEVNVDVTARKQAERQQADSEQRLRTQFALATVGQATFAMNGVFQQVNPALATMLGRQVGELESMTFDEITHPDERVANQRAAALLFTQDLPMDRSLRLLRADGGIVDAEVGMSLVRDSDGQPVGFIAVVQDVTARLAAERDRDTAASQLALRNTELQDSNIQLAAANAMKMDLMGMLSHEIGTPLNTITGYADLLLGNADGFADPQRKAVDVIARSARKLELLRAEILTMCILDAGQLSVDPEPVDVARALADAVAGLDLSVPIDCPAGLTVLVHPSHLQQIVTNFCTNATKYAGGVTAITVHRQDDIATIAVHDDGHGIPAELRPHLFDRYTRNPDTSMAIKGTGLGLYIVRGLAEANHGTAGFHPGNGGGSTFTLALPTAG